MPRLEYQVHFGVCQVDTNDPISLAIDSTSRRKPMVFLGVHLNF